MTVTDLQATVTIGGVSMAGYISSIERSNHLCKPAQTVKIKLSPNAPRGTFETWQSLVVSEQGTTVLTGFVEQVSYGRDPSRHIIISGKDTYKRCDDYFIPTALNMQGETVVYWVDYLCDLCGIDYTISASSGSSMVVGGTADDPISIGLRSVSDALLSVCAYARWCMHVGSDGVLEFRSSDIDYTSAYTLTDVKETAKITSDENTRTACKIFNMEGMIVNETRAVTGISQERIMAFGSPSLTMSSGSALSTAALDQFAVLSQTGTFTIPGKPELDVGTSVTIITGGELYFGPITDMETEMQGNAYTYKITLNRQCPRLPAFPTLPVLGYQYIKAPLVCTDKEVRFTHTLSSGSPIWVSSGSFTDIVDMCRVPSDVTQNSAYVLTKTNLYYLGQIQSGGVATDRLDISDYGSGEFVRVVCDERYGKVFVLGYLDDTQYVWVGAAGGYYWNSYATGNTSAGAVNTAFAVGHEGTPPLYTSGLGGTATHSSTFDTDTDGWANVDADIFEWYNDGHTAPGCLHVYQAEDPVAIWTIVTVRLYTWNPYVVEGDVFSVWVKGYVSGGLNAGFTLRVTFTDYSWQWAQVLGPQADWAQISLSIAAENAGKQVNYINVEAQSRRDYIDCYIDDFYGEGVTFHIARSVDLGATWATYINDIEACDIECFRHRDWFSTDLTVWATDKNLYRTTNGVLGSALLTESNLTRRNGRLATGRPDCNTLYALVSTGADTYKISRGVLTGATWAWTDGETEIIEGRSLRVAPGSSVIGTKAVYMLRDTQIQYSANGGASMQDKTGDWAGFSNPKVFLPF